MHVSATRGAAAVAALLLFLPSFSIAAPDGAPDLRAERAPAGALWLDELDVSAVEQEWGEPRRARSVDGRPLALGDAAAAYAHGVGTHAASEWEIDLHGAALRFFADVGVDAETGRAGSCRFEVWADGRRLFESPVLRGGGAPVRVDVDVAGAKTLRLVVSDGGDGIDHDHADWAGAMLTLKPGAEGRPVSRASEVTTDPAPPIWKGPDPAKPAIHGPRVVGSTPGRPFLYRVPATGQGPIRFAARSLPDGLSLDPATGIITGSLRRAGTCVVDLAVFGPKGIGRRKLAIVGGEDRLALTPPLGWNSWNVWGLSVTADRVRDAARAFEQSGLAAHGFAYVNIDDGWEAGRAPDGTILVNDKFGDMKTLADDVHAMGLKLGIYSSPGDKTCGGFTGSFGHVTQDARTYADWGIDYLKYDWCSYGSVAPDPSRAAAIWPYRVMQRALDAVPRDIVYSLCQYGMRDVWQWGRFVDGDCWRTTGDITDTWSSMSGIGFGQAERHPYAGPGGWNDPDMLVVGWVGWGPNLHPTRLTPNEQVTHVTLWSLLASPLLIGCDLTRLDDFTKALLTNDEVLDVDQDPLGRQARRVAREGRTEVWARPLFDGTVAVGLFNRDRTGAAVTARWKDLGLSGRQPVRDLWRRESAGVHRDGYSVRVPAHGAVLLKVGRPQRTEYVPGEAAVAAFWL